MPINTKCHDCGQPLRVPDELIGTNVKCPGCGSTFLAVAATSLPDQAIRPAPEAPEVPAESTTNAIRETAAPPAGTPGESTPGESREPLPRPQLDDFDQEEDEDDETMEERLYERRAEHRKTERLERARRIIRPPAIGMMVVAGSFFLVALGGIGLSVFMAVNIGGMGGGAPIGAGFGTNDIAIGVYLVGAVIELVLGGLTLYGALKMRKLQAWGLAMTVSILAIIASFGACCMVSFLGIVQVGIALPFGIWATIALNDADVKASFT